MRRMKSSPIHHRGFLRTIGIDRPSWKSLSTNSKANRRVLLQRMPSSSRASRWTLEGKTALVTGGTKGIGAACVEELASLGARVFTCARTRSDLEAALQSWSAVGYQVLGCVADCSLKDDRERLMKDVGAAFEGKLDILVNNVGTNIRKTTEEYHEEDYQKLNSTNLQSTFHLCQLAHPLMKCSGGGSIVMNSSVAGGPLAMMSGVLYAMFKAAMNQLTRYLAVEWAVDNIRVNAIAPWYVDTPLANQVMKNKDIFDKIIARTPLRRVGKPWEIAASIAFLCMNESGWTTGQIISIDGGYSVSGFDPRV